MCLAPSQDVSRTPVAPSNCAIGMTGSWMSCNSVTVANGPSHRTAPVLPSPRGIPIPPVTILIIGAPVFLMEAHQVLEIFPLSPRHDAPLLSLLIPSGGSKPPRPIWAPHGRNQPSTTVHGRDATTLP